MRLTRHSFTTAAVVVAVGCLVAATAHAVTQRGDDSAPKSSASPAASAPALRLSASPARITVGQTTTLRIASSTPHRRVVRIQRWDPRSRTWRAVASRTVKKRSAVKIRPAAGTWRYRAVRKKPAARAAVTVQVVKKNPTPTGPANLSADEKTLFNAVREARLQFATKAVNDAAGRADNCLTTYARNHSAWMATRGEAIDPAKSGRTQPGSACADRTVRAVTRAIGNANSTPVAVSTAVTSLLRSPYGETERLLSTCDTAPRFDFGVAVKTSGGVRWITVLVASPTSTTKSSGAC